MCNEQWRTEQKFRPRWRAKLQKNFRKISTTAEISDDLVLVIYCKILLFQAFTPKS